MGKHKVSETSRASLVNVTAGMANAMTRGKSIARVCKKCNRGVPAYPGRYPTRCPMCKGDLVAEAQLTEAIDWRPIERGMSLRVLSSYLAGGRTVHGGPGVNIDIRRGDILRNPYAARLGVQWELVRGGRVVDKRVEVTGGKTRSGGRVRAFRGVPYGLGYYNPKRLEPVLGESVIKYVGGQEPDPTAPVITPATSMAPALQKLLEAGSRHKDGSVELAYDVIDDIVPGGVHGLHWYTEGADDKRYRCEGPLSPVLVFEFDAKAQRARAYLTDAPQKALGFDPREEMVEDSGWSEDGWTNLDEVRSLGPTRAQAYAAQVNAPRPKRRWPYFQTPSWATGKQRIWFGELASSTQAALMVMPRADREKFWELWAEVKATDDHARGGYQRKMALNKEARLLLGKYRDAARAAHGLDEGDRDLRDLERRAAAGDPDAARRLSRARERMDAPPWSEFGLTKAEALVLLASLSWKSSHGGVKNLRWKNLTDRYSSGGFNITLGQYEAARASLARKKVFNKAGSVTRKARQIRDQMADAMGARGGTSNMLQMIHRDYGPDISMQVVADPAPRAQDRRPRIMRLAPSSATRLSDLGSIPEDHAGVFYRESTLGRFWVIPIAILKNGNYKTLSVEWSPRRRVPEKAKKGSTDRIFARNYYGIKTTDVPRKVLEKFRSRGVRLVESVDESDARERELERLAAQGDEQAQARLDAMRARWTPYIHPWLTRGSGDDVSATELKLYIENDGQLYRQRQSIEANLRRKLKRGKYDREKAPKLWLYWVTEGAWKYVKEFGGSVRSVFPKRLREYVAAELAAEFEEEGLSESALHEFRMPDPTTPPVVEPEANEDRRASAFRRRKEGDGRITRIYGGTRFTVGGRKRKPRKDVEASLQAKRNARRGQAKRIEAAKRWHQSEKGRRYHRELARFNTGNRRGESTEPFFATTTGAQLGIAESQDPVSMRDLAALERVLDQLFAAVGIDVEFTRHFFDRVNDRRNRQQITTGELASIFNEVFRRHAGKIKGRGADWQAVIKDITSNINIPFVLNYNRGTRMLELVAKTVMRKKGFKTSNKQLTVQTSATERAEAAKARIAMLQEASAADQVANYDPRSDLYLDRDDIPESVKGKPQHGRTKKQTAKAAGKQSRGSHKADKDIRDKERRNIARKRRLNRDHKPVDENFADAYPSNLPPLPADIANENPSIDDIFDSVMRRLIVIESSDVLEDVNFDENGSTYLFFDPSLTRKEVDEVFRWVQQEHQKLQLVASPDKSLPGEVAEADWWVMFLPGAPLEEGSGEVTPDPTQYAREDSRMVPPKQQIVVDAPATAPEAMAQGVDTNKLIQSIGERRARRWLAAHSE